MIPSHRIDFKTISQWVKINNIILVIIVIISLLITLQTTFKGLKEPILGIGVLKYYDILIYILKPINYLGMIAYFTIEIVVLSYIYPQAEQKRRLDFIDNSLGTKFSGKEIKAYFTNDTIQPSVYKMMVNSFENCFFSFSISSKMIPAKVFSTSVLLIIFLVLAYFGFQQNDWSTPLLQAILSSLFLKGLIEHLIFVGAVGNILKKFEDFFATANTHNFDNAGMALSIKLLLEYETRLAYSKYIGSDSVYKQYNDELSKVWEDKKVYYQIINFVNS